MCTVAECSPDVSVQKWRSVGSATPGKSQQATPHLVQIDFERSSLEEDVGGLAKHSQARGRTRQPMPTETTGSSQSQPVNAITAAAITTPKLPRASLNTSR